jgi:hypothetical protein
MAALYYCETSPKGVTQSQGTHFAEAKHSASGRAPTGGARRRVPSTHLDAAGIRSWMDRDSTASKNG